MLEAGCTACYDLFYEFSGPAAEGLAAAASAYAEAGMRAALAIHGDPPPGITLALAPTIPYHCSDAFLIGCRVLAEVHGLRLHTHVAESKLQALMARRAWGMGPVHHLDRHRLIGAHLMVAQAIWLETRELEALASRGARIEWLQFPQQTRHVRSDAARRHVSRILDVPCAQWIDAAGARMMATERSATVLGMGEEIGRIAPGFTADDAERESRVHLLRTRRLLRKPHENDTTPHHRCFQLRSRARAEGRVAIAGVEAVPTVMPLQPLFNLQMTQHTFDRCEFPIPAWLRQFDHGRQDYIGLPWQGPICVNAGLNARCSVEDHLQ